VVIGATSKGESSDSALGADTRERRVSGAGVESKGGTDIILLTTRTSAFVTRRFRTATGTGVAQIHPDTADAIGPFLPPPKGIRQTIRADAA
jgi:hypothetical protein